MICSIPTVIRDECFEPGLPNEEQVIRLARLVESVSELAYKYHCNSNHKMCSSLLYTSIACFCDTAVEGTRKKLRRLFNIHQVLSSSSRWTVILRVR